MPKPKPLPPFAAAVREARHHLRLEQWELAQHIGVSLRTLGRWESGQKLPFANASPVTAWAKQLPADLGGPILRALGVMIPQPALPPPPAPPPPPPPAAAARKPPPADEAARRFDDAIRIAAEQLDVGARSLRRALDPLLAAMHEMELDAATARKLAAKGR